MSEYGKILTRFWSDPEVARLDPAAKLLLLYYCTSPHSNMIGLYYCPHVYAGHETGLRVERVETCVAALAPFASFDHETHEVLVHRLARYRVGRELRPGDRRRPLIRALVDAAHSRALRARFLELYADWDLEPAGVASDPAPATPPPSTNGGAPQSRDQVLDYVTRCVVAANRGLAANPAVTTRREIVASTQVGRVTWAEDGIPLDLAARVVEERARSYRPAPHHPQPYGLSYFDAAVREAYERAREEGQGTSPRWLEELRAESGGTA